MEYFSELSKIKSKHILDNIFGFIKVVNLKLNLLKYSKYFQKILNITFFNYQNVYFKKANFYLPDFLSFKYEENEEFDKDLLQKKLENFLIKHPQLTISDINKYVEEFIPKYANKLKKEKVNNDQETNYEKSYNNFIDIYSPFFELISKSEHFGNIFTINIPTNLIIKNNLENSYINIFDNLEKDNYNYYSIKIILNDTKDLDILEKFKIKFNRLNKINILENNSIENYNTFLDKLFSFFSKDNTLKYLNLAIPDKSENIIENKVIEKINNFQQIEHLELENFLIQNPFILNLPKLKYLNIKACENIGFAENSLLNLERLIIDITEVIKDENGGLIKLPKANYISIIDEGNFIYNTIFDFSSFQNVKTLICNKHDFPSLTNLSLETLSVSLYKKEDEEMEKQMIEKIIQMKELKNLICSLSIDANDVLMEIKGENPSVEKITIIKENICEEHVINNFINLFPNAHHLNLFAVNTFIYKRRPKQQN